MKEQIEAVQRMQNYIAAHLYEQITLAELLCFLRGIHTGCSKSGPT